MLEGSPERLEFVIEPAAGCAIGDGGVMQDHKGGHDGAQAIDVEIAGRGCIGDGAIGRGGSGCIRSPLFVA